MKKILLSGVKPTGRPHIGNYFGAMKQFVDLQDQYESRIFVANLHALTSLESRDEMRQNSLDVVLDYLAIGLDPNKTTLYLQSDVPHVTELAWIFETLTTMPYLMRAHAFKDAEAKNKDINVGTFNYPLLMAADILGGGGEVVPVGADQKQHIEIARDTAEKFNRVYGEVFKLPEPLIYEMLAVVPGTDGQKMSKSYGNTIPLFATKDELSKAVMKIVTNSEGTTPNNVYSIHLLVNMALKKDPVQFDNLYKENKSNHKILKEALLEELEELISPMRERRKEWEGKQDEVKKIITEGGHKMRKVVHEKMAKVRDKVGLIHHD